MWKLVLYAVGLAVNLFALSLELRGIIQADADITFSTVILTVLCGMFAAFLYSEIGKPKA